MAHKASEAHSNTSNLSEEARLGLTEETFQREARDWERLTRRYQTRYYEMLCEVVSRVRIPPRGRIIDLGGASGILAEMLLNRFPDAHVTVLDLSSKMLELAEKRLNHFRGRAFFFQGYVEDMPNGPHDAVVSTLTLHHLEGDDNKRLQYKKILDSLKPGGCFWQGDYVLSSHPEDSAHNEEEWVKWLRGQGFSSPEIQELRNRVQNHDRPAALIDHLGWLTDLGFEYVDCTWRYIKFAVFGGRKATLN
jgi:tRNA (cmo5U34)-methyltransferase